MNIKTVLFDLDGTLIDTLPLIRETYRRVFAEMGIPWGNDDVMGWVGRPIRDIARFFAGEDRMGEFIGRYQEIYFSVHDETVKLFPGTAVLLRRLKEAGFLLGVVTSKGRIGAQRALDSTGLGEFVQVVVTADDASRHKPDPEPVRVALARLGTDAGDAVFVGDSSYDILAGRAAGTRTLGVTWGLLSREELVKLGPYGILDNWDDIWQYLS